MKINIQCSAQCASLVTRLALAPPAATSRAAVRRPQAAPPPKPPRRLLRLRAYASIALAIVLIVSQ